MDQFERETIALVLLDIGARFENEEAYELALKKLLNHFAIYGHAIVLGLANEAAGGSRDPRSLN